MSRLQTRLLGLAGTIALIAFVIGTPALLLAVDATPTVGNIAWSTLTSPDDGTVALAVIGVVAWISWAVFACSVVVEIASRMRGLKAPSLPGLVIPQLAAGRLVGVAALLFVTAPVIFTVAHAPRAVAEPAPAPTALAAEPALPPEVEVAPKLETPAPAERTEAYTVKRGDSLWKIAKERLGDGTRYIELAELNRETLHGEPDFLMPGTVLQVPAEATAPDEASYVVEPGDTLSQIAESELGDADDYPEIFEASRSTVQPDGDRLSDPDIIRPGWRLTIPGDHSTDHPVRPKHRHELPPESQPTAPPTTMPEAPSTNAPAAARTADEAAAASDGDQDLPSWVLPGLAGGGAALAGSLLLVLRQHRRTQLRYRRPGHVVVPPPPELRPAEKSAHASGALTAPRIDDLDRALRHLGDPSTTCPRVLTAALSSETVTLGLVEPAVLPAPWSGAGTSWTHARRDIPADRPGSVAPYPLLVSLGLDTAGALVYVNLEEIRSAALTGASDHATALGRHIAAELSLNPWSTLVEIDTLGIGDELADIDPTRLHHHARGDTAFLDRLASDLEAENPALEPDQYRALITTTAATDSETVPKIAKIITGYGGRAGAAVITIGEEDSPGEIEMRLTSTGRVSIEALRLDLRAAGLTADEARACATLVDITRETSIALAPVDSDPAHLADATGALKPDLIAPRPANAPAGSGSLLPLDVSAYETRAATVSEDVQRLAPVAVPDAEARIEGQDPDLDEDVARWQASRLMGPKLTLLGPVSARTLGDSRKMAHRRPFYTELLAFLVLHPSGATADEVAGAFGIQPERARKDLGILRGWLGVDARTGELHLPNARQTHTDGVKAKYVVNGIATDMDLFRRLRTRGQSRGAAGMDDLRMALTLVSGEPFSDLRPTGWGWILEDERFDHLMSCAIVDTAHIVTTHALSIGDLDLARFAAETAVDAAPYDETSRLDLVAVDKASGEEDRADRRLVDDVLDRSDDDLGPIEVPEQTAKIIRQRGWDERRARSAG